MSKQKIKGLSAFRLLEGLDDDMILSASLPEAAPVSVPTKGERIAAFFGRMGKSGVAAAVISVAVVLAALTGVVLAGHMGTANPPDTDSGQGIHGYPPHESEMLSGTNAGTNAGNNGVLIPPLEQNPEQEKGEVAVVSDGITVYPKGYCVYISEMRRDDNGDLIGMDGDGFGAVYQLGDIWDSLPVMQTSGNDFDLILPDNMTLRSIRVFEMVEVQTKTFEELAITEPGLNLSADPLGCLSRLNGFYTVVLEIYHETIYSEDEYTKGVDEYAFKLEVNPSMNATAPVRVLQGDKTYFPTGYLLTEIYYDAELKQEITKHYDGATYQLQALIPDMVTATVIRRDSITPEDALSLYLAPFYDLREITVYDERLNEITKAHSTEPLETLPSWDGRDYYVIISTVFSGTGMTEVMEFPIHIQVVEEVVEEEVEKPSLPEAYHLMLEDLVLDNGYMLWAEAWYDGVMSCAEGLGAKGQLKALVAGGALEEYRLRFPVDTPFLYKQNGAEAPLDWVTVYDMDLNLVGEAPNFTVIHTPPLPAGEYIVILTVKYQGDYIPEADAYEGVCYEYPFILELYNPE